jgi:glycerate kinase
VVGDPAAPAAVAAHPVHLGPRRGDAAGVPQPEPGGRRPVGHPRTVAADPDGHRLQPRFYVVTRYLDFDELLDRADLVITAEGAIDRQSARGKVPAEVARRASVRDIPVIALSGTVGEGVQAALDAGLDAYGSILTRPCSLEQALQETAEFLVSSAEQTMRLLLVGRRLAWQEAEVR